jgi:carbon monoxide dehydrogenase subunit G
MAVKVKIDIDREFTVSADYATVFGLLSSVEDSGKFFPKVDQLTDEGDGVFRWEMGKVGIGDHAIQTIYASKYVSDEDAGTVDWTPVKGVGNGLVSGGWRIKETSNGTEARLTSSAELTLPLPGLLKLAISPVVKHEFTGMVDEYLENLQAELNG